LTFRAETVAPAEVLDRWQKDCDPWVWKLIISPEFGERIDLNQLTREVMRRTHRDLRTLLERVAVAHFNRTPARPHRRAWDKR
jgi:hypothetical protein